MKSFEIVLDVSKLPLNVIEGLCYKYNAELRVETMEVQLAEVKVK